MQEKIVRRVILEANYIINTNKTIREISKSFNVSKSTVHNDLHYRLKRVDKNLFIEVSKILRYHDLVKHISGGAKTKLKYAKEQS